MTWGIVASAGANLVAGAMGADAASEAGAVQAASADRAEAGIQKRFDQTRADYEPFRQSGVAANKRLATLLGLPMPSEAAPDREAIRARLAPQFTTSTLGSGPVWSGPSGEMDGYWTQGAAAAPSTSVDEAGLQAAIEKEVSSQPPSGAPSNDPAYGSLLKKFSADDLNADPVYQSGLKFGLDQGTGAINARAIAGGGYDSGATLKALTRYAEDYGSTKANESFNRFNTANDSVYNKLAGVSGAGQSATGQVASAGQTAANTSAGLVTDAGNARAAGIVGGANAWGGAAQGISQGVNNYNSNQMLKGLLTRSRIPSASDYTGGGIGDRDLYGYH